MGVLKAILLAVISGKAKVLTMIFLDAAFVVMLVLFGRLVGMLAPSLNSSIFSTIGSSQLWYVLLLLAVYSLFLLFLYSLVKFLVLHYVQSLFEQAQMDFGRFLSFYGLNLCLFAIFGALYALIAYFIAAVRQPYAAVVLLFLSIPYVILLFITLSSAHALFHGKDKGAWKSLSQGFSFTFTKARIYGKIIGVSALVVLVFLLLLFLIGLGIRSMAFAHYGFYASAYGIFAGAISILSPVVAYVILLFNRIGFYYIIRKG